MGDIKVHLERTGCMGVGWINSPQDMNEWWGCCEHGNEHLASIKCSEFLSGNVTFSEMTLRHSVSCIVWQNWLLLRISPSLEATGCPATQKIPHILYNHNPLLIPILSDTNPIHNLPRYNVMYILILSFYLLSGLPNDLSPSGFITRSIHTFLMFRMHATNPTIIHCKWYKNHVLKNVIT